jgi:hypothetical protein
MWSPPRSRSLWLSGSTRRAFTVGLLATDLLQPAPLTAAAAVLALIVAAPELAAIGRAFQPW